VKPANTIRDAKVAGSGTNVADEVNDAVAMYPSAVEV
jgi:hypothetical protein